MYNRGGWKGACKFAAAIVHRGGAVQWKDQASWDQTDVGFNSNLGIFLFQELGQVRVPLSLIPRFPVWDTGIKEPPNLTVG